MHELDQAVCHAFCAKSRANPGWPIMLMLCIKNIMNYSVFQVDMKKLVKNI